MAHLEEGAFLRTPHGPPSPAKGRSQERPSFDGLCGIRAYSAPASPFSRKAGEGAQRADEGKWQAPLTLFAHKTLHEFTPAAPADAPAAFGFALGLAARAMAQSRAHGLIVAEDFALREHGGFHGPGLAAHGLDLDRLIFVRAPSAIAAFGAMEEGLRSGALAFALADVWDLKPYSLTVSRRLLLAARAGQTPALLVQSGAHHSADKLSTAAQTRAEIAAAPSLHRSSAGGGRGLPGAPAFAVRIVKAKLGQGPPGAHHDPEHVFPLHWRGESHDFVDPTVSEPMAAASADRPGAAAAAHRGR